jgi:hypothetical protein
MHVVTDDGMSSTSVPTTWSTWRRGPTRVVGDEPVVQVEWSGVRGWLEPLE